MNNQAMASFAMAAALVLRLGVGTAQAAGDGQQQAVRARLQNHCSEQAAEDYLHWQVDRADSFEPADETCDYTSDAQQYLISFELEQEDDSELAQSVAAQAAETAQAQAKNYSRRLEVPVGAQVSSSTNKKALEVLQDAESSGGSLVINGRLYHVSFSTTARTTAYTHTGNRTASGLWPEAGMAAVQKRARASNLPFGTKIYVDGYGLVTVQDTGDSGMERYGGVWLDLFMETNSECVAWGMRQRNIYVLY